MYNDWGGFWAGVFGVFAVLLILVFVASSQNEPAPQAASVTFAEPQNADTIARERALLDALEAERQQSKSTEAMAAVAMAAIEAQQAQSATNWGLVAGIALIAVIVVVAGVVAVVGMRRDPPPAPSYTVHPQLTGAPPAPMLEAQRRYDGDTTLVVRSGRWALEDAHSGQVLYRQ